MKILVLLVLLATVLSLGSALSLMTRKSGNPRAVANALTIRVALSAGLVLILIAGWAMGWLEPVRA